MSIILSTGMRNHIQGTDDTAAALNGGFIKMYGSAVSQDAANALIPATADAALGSALLICIISVDGTGGGLNFDATPVNGLLSKSTLETWLGAILASGWYSFYRFVSATDDGTLSTTQKRVQGTVGILGTDLIVNAAYKALGGEQRIGSYILGMP